jgi:glutathione S-transferase
MITLWGRRNSMNVQKVIWALEELKLPYERHNAAGSYGGTGTAEFKAMNPMSLVPVIRDGDVTMFESNAIVRYLAARYGDSGLRPGAPNELAAAEQWMDWTQLNLGPPVMTLFLQLVRTPQGKQDHAAMEKSVAQLHRLLPIADTALAKSRFLASDRLTFGDIPLGVMMWRLSCFDWRRPSLANLGRWQELLQTGTAYRKAVMLPTGRTPEEWLAYEKQFA